MRVKAKNLLPGDLIDLAGDNYADPDNGDAEFEFEYAVVYETDRETRDCVRVSFENGRSFGFPTNHRFQVFGRDRRVARIALELQLRRRYLRAALQCFPTAARWALGRRGHWRDQTMAETLRCLRVALTGRV